MEKLVSLENSALEIETTKFWTKVQDLSPPPTSPFISTSRLWG